MIEPSHRIPSPVNKYTRPLSEALLLFLALWSRRTVPKSAHRNILIPSAATTGIRDGISPYKAPESNALAGKG